MTGSQLLKTITKLIKKSKQLDPIYQNIEGDLFLKFADAPKGLEQALAFKKWKDFVNKPTLNIKY